MKKAEFNKRGTRQIVDTGWKEFDRQTNCISTGNIIANTQLSMVIRPDCKTECNGGKYDPGQLMEWDLELFNGFDIPYCIRSMLRNRRRRRNMILYMFYTVPSRYVRPRRTPFLWVLTDEGHRLVRSEVVREYGVKTSKRLQAEKEILKYITEDEDEEG